MPARPSIPRTAFDLYQQPTSRLDDVYDPEPRYRLSPPQRQQQRTIVSPTPKPASSASGSVHSLRRAPRLRTPSPPLKASVGRPAPPRRTSSPRRITPPKRPTAADQVPTFDQSGSTTSQNFQKLVEDDAYWPERSVHISRRTHDAILFALEAIRRGRGVDAKPLTEDTLEVRARMSDLISTSQPSGRTQNGGTRPAQSFGPTPADPPRYRTPTDVMRERRLREARKAEQQEAERQRQQEEDQIRRRQQQQESVGAESQPNRRTGSSQIQGYTIGGTATQQPSQSNRRQESTASGPQARTTAAQQQQGFQPGHARLSSTTQRNRTEAYETLNIPATAKAAPQPQQQQQPPPPPQKPSILANSAPPQTVATQPKAAFPHAFERWETLSSHWEGLTSYWIRRLQENTNELNGKPLDQQLSRQITDLSAAGANLFHAVVELQRLRASSERKFQRWFFETRNEQEQAAERQAELEKQLQAERDARTNMEAAGSAEAVRAEKAKAEEMVREMRRELLISKEEARRAWEELGRREQEERERTIALRSGEPTLIGGVQVVPMQGMASRQVSSAQRPQTRDGSYPGGPSATVMGGMQPPQQPPSRSQTTTTSLDSPGEEHRQFSYQPRDTSPSSSDPFQEGIRRGPGDETHQLRHEPDTRFYLSSSQQPASSAAMAAAAQLAASSGGSQFYQQPSPQTTIHQPLSNITQQTHPSRSAVGQSSAPSFVPSITGSSVGEEEFHINPDGTYTLDSQGRRIPYHRSILDSPELAQASPQRYGTQHEDVHSDDESYTSDIARERMHAQQYPTSSSAARPPIPQDQPPRETLQNISGNVPRTTPSAMPSIPQGQVASTNVSSGGQQAPADYEGSSYGPGWEGVTPRHRHPTRLSDILEEGTSRTSPSRGSYVSGSGAAPR